MSQKIKTMCRISVTMISDVLSMEKRIIAWKPKLSWWGLATGNLKLILGAVRVT